MTFIVTARKWRPQLFSEVVGQQHISTTLKNAIENNRIGHAYIFAGPRGVGKTTTARILAKRLNCESPNGGEPCNNCPSCDNFLKSQSLDIIEIDGASNRRIDEIRTLRESVKYAPTSGLYKVYIIDEVHMLTTESFNALLKTLEEPPEHTIFIFATTDIHKVPLTIISRCQRFDFRRIELDEITELLKKIAAAENIIIDNESLTIIAKKADGALRDAESIFDQVVSFCGNSVDVSILRQMLNLIDDEIYFNISEAILKNDFNVAYEVSSKIFNNGWNFIDFINGLLEHFRNINSVIITKSAKFIESSEIHRKKYLEYMDSFSEGDLLRILTFLIKIQNELRLAQNQKLKVEISLTQLIGFTKSTTISKLLSKASSSLQEEKKKNKNSNLEPINSTNEPTLKIDYPKTSIKKNIKKTESEKKITINNTESVLSIDTPFKEFKTLEDFLGIWEDFKKDITKERFLLGPLLEHSTPVSYDNHNILFKVTNKDDVDILSSSHDFLSKRFDKMFKNKLKFNFEFNESSKNNQSPNSSTKQSENNNSVNDNPVIKSVVEILGGREIK